MPYQQCYVNVGQKEFLCINYSSDRLGSFSPPARLAGSFIRPDLSDAAFMNCTTNQHLIEFHTNSPSQSRTTFQPSILIVILFHNLFLTPYNLFYYNNFICFFALFWNYSMFSKAPTKPNLNFSRTFIKQSINK